MPDSRSHPPGLLVLCYLTFLGFIPLLAAKQNREVRWHAANGLLLFGVVVAIGVAATVIGILVPPLSCLYGIVMFVVLVLYTIVAILRYGLPRGAALAASRIVRCNPFSRGGEDPVP